MKLILIASGTIHTFSVFMKLTLNASRLSHSSQFGRIFNDKKLNLSAS
jgi:hypothetical protein